MWFADKTFTVTGFVCCPGTGNAAAKQRRPQHCALQRGTTIEVASRHTSYFAGRIKAGYRIEILVEHPTLKICFDSPQ